MSLKIGTLINKKQLTHDVVEFEFATEQDFQAEAGQFVNIKIENGGTFPLFRAYSIAEKPQGKSVKICVKVLTEGKGSKWLNEIQIGHQIKFLGPQGKFFFEPKSENTLFIATGTGIAPLKVMIEDQLQKGLYKGKMTLLFGLRAEEDLFYQEEFQNLAKSNGNFSFTSTLSQPQSTWTGASGRVTDLLEKTKLDPTITQVYICGLKAMINDVCAILEKQGFKKDLVHFEKYD